MVSAPSSSGCRSALHRSRRARNRGARRGARGTPVCGQADLARAAAATLRLRPGPATEIEWCGARIGRSVSKPLAGKLARRPTRSKLPSPTASSKVSGEEFPVKPARASMVLPEPGGPMKSRLWPPAAAISKARLLKACCPRTSLRSSAARIDRARNVPGREKCAAADHSSRRGHRVAEREELPITRAPTASAASRSLAIWNEQLSRDAELSREQRDRQRPANRQDRAGQREAQLPAPSRRRAAQASDDSRKRSEQAERDRQIEGGAFLAQIGRSEIDGRPLLRECRTPSLPKRGNAAHLRLDARGVRQPDEKKSRQAEREIDLHTDRRRLLLPRGPRFEVMRARRRVERAACQLGSSE